ncbi:hypothetical protein GCM10027292_01140 [Hydrogenophaga aquatica]
MAQEGPMNSPKKNNEGHTPLWRRPLALAWAAAAVIAVFYLLREHWGHVLGWWPYLVLMLCPLMHLLHGHGGHHSRHGHKKDSA